MSDWDLEHCCPRCGGDCSLHATLRELTVPFYTLGFVGTHWFMCRALREPVIVGRKPLWRWVALLRWQIAQVFQGYFKEVVKYVPDASAFSWTETKTDNSTANAKTYLVNFMQTLMPVGSKP